MATCTCVRSVSIKLGQSLWCLLYRQKLPLFCNHLSRFRFLPQSAASLSKLTVSKWISLFMYLLLLILHFVYFDIVLNSTNCIGNQAVKLCLCIHRKYHVTRRLDVASAMEGDCWVYSLDPTNLGSTNGSRVEWRFDFFWAFRCSLFHLLVDADFQPFRKNIAFVSTIVWQDRAPPVLQCRFLQHCCVIVSHILIAV